MLETIWDCFGNDFGALIAWVIRLRGALTAVVKVGVRVPVSAWMDRWFLGWLHTLALSSGYRGVPRPTVRSWLIQGVVFHVTLSWSWHHKSARQKFTYLSYSLQICVEKYFWMVVFSVRQYWRHGLEGKIVAAMVSRPPIAIGRWWLTSI